MRAVLAQLRTKVLFFYIQSFSLTECIVIVGVERYRGCLSVCVSVCLSVCVSVESREPKLLGRFQ